MNKVNISLASYPMMSFIDAMKMASEQTDYEVKEVQLCPQNRGILTASVADELMASYPETQFRLHANVRVLPDRRILNWSDFDEDPAYWDELAARSKQFRAQVYTAHAGLRAKATLEEVFEKVARAEEKFGCKVGVEHHYPTAANQFLLSTWDEMEHLLNSGVNYVIDMAHIMILAHFSKKRNETLISELLSSENCIEVHYSWCDGIRDSHLNLPPESEIWWWPLTKFVNPSATIFVEGNLRH